MATVTNTPNFTPVQLEALGHMYSGVRVSYNSNTGMAAAIIHAKDGDVPMHSKTLNSLTKKGMVEQVTIGSDERLVLTREGIQVCKTLTATPEVEPKPEPESKKKKGVEHRYRGPSWFLLAEIG